MSATDNSNADIIDSGIPLARLAEAKALPNFVLQVTWAEGTHAGETQIVNLAPAINSYTHYKPLRGNEELFSTVHLIEDGDSVVWGDEKIEMSADMIEALAEDIMSPRQFAEFLENNELKPEDAAVILGRSRRQIYNYLKNGPIPRIVALACEGYQARRMKGHTLEITEALRQAVEDSNTKIGEYRVFGSFHASTEYEWETEEYYQELDESVDVHYESPDTPPTPIKPKVRAA